MSILSATAVIHRPIDEVFSFISDYQNDWKWRSHRIDFLRNENIESNLLTVTHNYYPLYNNQQENIKYQIIKYSKNEQLISQFQLGIITIIDERKVSAVQEYSTQCHHSLRIESSGIWKIVASLLYYRLSHSLTKDMQWLKEMMEKLSFPVSAIPEDIHNLKNSDADTRFLELT